MFVTGFNMVPSGQFDGGHIIHALLGRRSVYLSRGFLIVAILWVVLCEQYTWIVMVVLLTLIGTDHPPTADDTCPLGWPSAFWAGCLSRFRSCACRWPNRVG